MTTVDIPNGFIGNLNSDQEWKLQQLWMVLLKALEASSGAENSTSQRKSSISRTETNGSARASVSSTRVDSSQLSESLKDLGLDATQIRTITQSLSNLNTDELHRGFLASIKNENPDVLMLRFLRARKWDVGNAFAMMIGSVEWRIKEMGVDDVLAKGDLHALKKSKDGKTPAEKKDGTMFLKQSRIGKAFVRGTDHVGRPIVVVQVRLHKPGEQSEEVLNEFIVHVIEAVRLLLRPPVETATILFDMTNFSLSNMEYPPVKFIIRCFEANYPESLGLMLIHNAPWIFSGIWKLIKGWMDPVIVSKVQFTRSMNDLKEFIPQENILKPMG
ncbi:phosphatidylinositol transfer protein csr1, partial [Elasticomyces elasticus]